MIRTVADGGTLMNVSIASPWGYGQGPPPTR